MASHAKNMMKSKHRSGTKKIGGTNSLQVSHPGDIATKHMHEGIDPRIEQMKRIMAGKIEDLPPISSKTIRLFVSSTFSGKNKAIAIFFCVSHWLDIVKPTLPP